MSTQLQITTPTDTTIVIKRKFQAPRRLVWDAMTRPELLRRWMFCPPGWTWAECSMDVRAAGRFRWAWNGPDGQLALSISGEHREVTPPGRLVHTEEMTMGPGACCSGEPCADEPGANHASCPDQPGEVVVTLQLDERGGETSMTMTISCPSKAIRDAMVASGMDQGMEAGYKQLDALLVEQAHEFHTRS